MMRGNSDNEFDDNLKISEQPFDLPEIDFLVSNLFSFESSQPAADPESEMTTGVSVQPYSVHPPVEHFYMSAAPGDFFPLDLHLPTYTPPEKMPRTDINTVSAPISRQSLLPPVPVSSIQQFSDASLKNELFEIKFENTKSVAGTTFWLTKKNKSNPEVKTSLFRRYFERYCGALQETDMDFYDLRIASLTLATSNSCASFTITLPSYILKHKTYLERCNAAKILAHDFISYLRVSSTPYGKVSFPITANSPKAKQSVTKLRELFSTLAPTRASIQASIKSLTQALTQSTLMLVPMEQASQVTNAVMSEAKMISNDSQDNNASFAVSSTTGLQANSLFKNMGLNLSAKPLENMTPQIVSNTRKRKQF